VRKNDYMRNVNICFQDGTYQKIKDLVERRKISRFVNEAVEEKLQKSQEQEKKELEQRLREGYKRIAKNKTLQKEMEI